MHLNPYSEIYFQDLNSDSGQENVATFSPETPQHHALTSTGCLQSNSIRTHDINFLRESTSVSSSPATASSQVLFYLILFFRSFFSKYFLIFFSLIYTYGHKYTIIFILIRRATPLHKQSGQRRAQKQRHQRSQHDNLHLWY